MSTKNIVNIIAGCLSVLHLNAQFSITGSISSPTGKAIPFAIVGVQNTFLSTQANEQGKFTFEGLKPGNYLLITQCVGYKKRIDSVQLNSDIILDILLKNSDVSLDEIVVSSTRADKNTGIAFTNLSKEDIQKQNLGQDAPYILNNLPSVVVNSDAGNAVGYTGIRIRGSDATRINVTINGIPVNDAESQGTYWVDMPDVVSSANNIQVQRGVGTSANGAGAFGASINLQTNTLNEKPYAQAISTGGSFNTFRNSFLAGTGLINDHFTFDARASYITSDGYIDRASSKLNSYYFSGGYYGKKSVLKFIAFSGLEKTYQAWYYVPEDSIKKGNRTYNPAGEYYDANGKVHYYNNETDNYQQDNYQLHFIQQINDKLNFNLAGHYTKGKGYYEEYKQSQSLSNYGLDPVILSNDTIYSTDLIRRLWLNNDFVGGIFSLNYTPQSRIKFTFGGGYNSYFGRHYDQITWAQFASNSEINQVYNSDNANKNDGNFYLKTNYKPINNLNVFIDLQYRMINYIFNGPDDSLNNKRTVVNYGFFNPKFGLNYDLSSRTAIYASFGMANKEPNRNDFVQSTPKSRPKYEQLMDIEAGINQSFKNLGLNLNFYDMEYNNQLVLNGQVNNVGAYNRINVAKSYRRGLEFQAQFNITKYVNVNANITLSKNKIKDFTEYIDSTDASYSVYTQYKIQYKETDISFSPNIISSGVITLKPFKGFEFSIINKYVGRQYLDNTTNIRRSINPYYVMDARINYTIKTKWNSEVGFMLSVYNLLSTKYETNGYTFSYYTDDKLNTFNYLAPAAPINVLGGISFKF